MKRRVFYIVLVCCLFIGCTAEEFDINGYVGEKEVWATLRFGHCSFEHIEIDTRATSGDIAESRVENLFVYVFDASGNRLYSHYYDYNNRVESLPAETGNYWTVSNRTTNNDNDTKGEIMIKSPVLSGGSIYLIANLNADQLNISPEQLNTIETLKDLKALTITLNQEITSRTGCFLMTGSANGISIDENGSITQNNSAVHIPLIRLDAKITVNVKIGEASVTNQRMKDFVPETWQVMRLPKGTNLLQSDEDADILGYFDGKEQHFESVDGNEKGFSFYMLENMENTMGITKYAQRDLRKKKADGSYDIDNGMWEYTSEDATYIVIKGKVKMEVDSNDENKTQYLEADVTYYIHLGNFGSSTGEGDYNDFTIARNTHYTYTITIRGVQNIELEVTSDIENQPGAMGNVYKSNDEIYTFDAHYGQRVFCINVESVLEDAVTWYVKTPFSEGTPAVESGTQIPNIDYKWVWFMLNDLNGDGTYSTNNKWYPGDRYKESLSESSDNLMNVVEFVQFVKEEKDKFDKASDLDKSTVSAFKPDGRGGYCIYVTVFVDEYYYESDPLNKENAPQDLWKKFVNKPNRLMHILCDSKVSKDKSSSLTNSVITIRQQSIQTPYNIDNSSLLTAWGCESVDEFAQSQLFFYSNNEIMTSGQTDNYTLGTDIGKASDFNGLYNSLRMWGIVPGTTRWDEFLNYNRPNDYTTVINGHTITSHFLLDKRAVLRYATLLRNRDNNGNGIIDAEELRWYVASINQLYDLYIGQLGLNSEAALYTAQMAAQPNEVFASGPYSGAYKWRNHVICSTWDGGEGSNAQIKVLWAEEGISTDGYFARHNKYAPFSVRSIRNLGLSNPAYAEEGEEGSGYPTLLVQVSENENGSYRFNLSNLNESSMRYYTSGELEPGNEHAETSRVYSGFETGTTIIREEQGGNFNSGNYLSLKEALERGEDIGMDVKNGYRVPNVREAALMSIYCSSEWWNGGYTMVGTWYSNGNTDIGGTGNDPNYYSWQFGYRSATIGRSNVNTIRSVRDWSAQ